MLQATAQVDPPLAYRNAVVWLNYRKKRKLLTCRKRPHGRRRRRHKREEQRKARKLRRLAKKGARVAAEFGDCPCPANSVRTISKGNENVLPRLDKADIVPMATIGVVKFLARKRGRRRLG